MLIGLALTVVPARGASGDDQPVGPLPWRVGGRVGFSVDAASFPDSAGQQLEVYTRIPPATLVELTRDSLGDAHLRLEARLRSRFGARQHEAAQEFSIAPGDTLGGFGKVVMVRFPAETGTHRLHVRLEDLLSRKRGLIYSGRNITESETVEGEVMVPPAQAGRDLSDLEFVWAEDSVAAPSAFQHGDRRLLPNPERLYGLYASNLRAYFVARVPDGDRRPWHWIARVLDAQGHEVAERESLGSAGHWLSALLTLDLTHVPAGGYDLELKAWQEGDPGALLRRAHFSIGWRVESWLHNPRDIQDEVHFLLTPDEEEAFGNMHPGEQEQYLERFWLERDPTPDTAENEARETFLKRVDFANRTYSRFGIGKGMFSDMGRVFIRYGEPGEVLRQVIPSGDETLTQLLQQIEGNEDRSTGDVRQKGLGADQRPFEVWIYEGEIPLPPDADPKARENARHRKRLEFLFVDEQGLGSYTLRYSTE